MKLKNIAILTSRQSWFIPYARLFLKQLRRKGFSARLFSRHEDVSAKYETIFILSYFRMIPKEFLSQHRHNLVVHESALPGGSGWAPLFWQILEGKNQIPVVLFEANERIDAGDIYLKSLLCFKGHELYEEIRQDQALKTISLCQKFLSCHGKSRPQRQRGKRTFYRKRSPADSELDIRKSIQSQFDLLRVVNNEEFPAYFFYRGKKYTLKIFKESKA